MTTLESKPGSVFEKDSKTNITNANEDKVVKIEEVDKADKDKIHNPSILSKFNNNNHQLNSARRSDYDAFSVIYYKITYKITYNYLLLIGKRRLF